MKKRSLIWTVVAVVAAVVVAGGLAALMALSRGEAQAAGPEALQQTAWTLVTWKDPTPVPAGAITLSVEDGHVFGVSACNNYTGPVATSDTSFEVTENLATTKMFCFDEATTAAEDTYLRLLPTVTTWQVVGGELILSDAAGELLRFTAGG